MAVEKHVEVTIRGLSGLLYHAYLGDSAGSRQGDKNPRKIAEAHLHTIEDPQKGEVVYIPGRAIFACLVNAGVFQKLGRRAMSSAKASLVPAYLTVLEEACYLIGPDKKIVTPKHGWDVNTGPVVNPSTGGRVISHRPLVQAGWTTKFTLVLSEPLTYGEDMARALVDHAGTKMGLLAFRPQKRGPYGKFNVISWNVIADVDLNAA